MIKAGILQSLKWSMWYVEEIIWILEIVILSIWEEIDYVEKKSFDIEKVLPGLLIFLDLYKPGVKYRY